ncbi:MAG: HDOD domain-containing protein [Pseudomonadota bacterium]
MPENKYLARAPLLDPQQQVKGYKLAWQKAAADDVASEADTAQLLQLVAERVAAAELGLLFLDARLSALSSGALNALPPKTTVLMLPQEDVGDAEALPLAVSLREQGFGLALCGADPACMSAEEASLSFLTHFEVSLAQPGLPELISQAKYAKPPFSLLVQGIPDWQAFDACAALGLNGFFGNLCLVPRKPGQMKAMSPQTVLLLQLMQMVQENVDIRHLEKVLKRDPALSYKLFRYINSASFGIEVEIQSLRHAVAMLGYKPLFRWLSVLLALTSTEGFSPALLQAAIVRGRFAELLGQGLLSKGEAENLFVVGMFSLLDQLLGVPIQEVFKQILLPDAIAQALLTRGGVYGPFLSLAEACEQPHDGASKFADALFMTSTRVNQAHLSALAWAQNLKL